MDVELGTEPEPELSASELLSIPSAGGQRLHRPVLLLRREDRAAACGSPLLQRPVRLAEAVASEVDPLGSEEFAQLFPCF